MAHSAENPMDAINNIVLQCMGEDAAPCIAACPMNCSGKDYIRLMGENKGDEAMAVIRQTLFLPGSLGRICAHPCETSCKYSEMKNPLSIAAIKRYITDRYDAPEKWDMKKAPATGKKVAVIGAGPAGGQAAKDLVKKGHEVVVFDRLSGPGGMMRVGIPNYRLPNEVIEFEFSYLEKLGVQFRYNTTVGTDITMDQLQHEFDAIVLAIGKQVSIMDRSVKGHDSNGVFGAVDFLKEISETENFNGVGKRVLVVGGGDVAMDCARSARRLAGVENVELACLEGSIGTLTASKHESYGAIDEGVEFNFGVGLKEIATDSNGRVNKIIFKKCLSLLDEAGNFAPSFDENQISEKEFDTVIYAIGQRVDTSITKNMMVASKASLVNDDVVKRTDLNLNPNGTFENVELTNQSSSISNVFIAGDCDGRTFIVVQAMASGAKAAESVDRYLHKKDLGLGRTLQKLTPVKVPLNWAKQNRRARVKITERPVDERLKDFKEIDAGYTDEEIKAETGRCLQCSCRLCMDECVMMHDFGASPKEILLKLTQVGWENYDPTLAFSCSTCNQCTIVCPKSLDLKSAYMGLRRAYTKKNHGKSPMPGHKSIEMHQLLGFSPIFTTSNKAPQNKKTKYLFFPGCSFPSYSSDGVKQIMSYLNDKLDGQVGSLQMCCGKPTKAMGQADKMKERLALVEQKIKETGAEEVLVACQNCFLTLGEYMPVPVRSLWTMIPQLGVPDTQKGIGANSDIVFNIHDSCPTRNNPEIHEGVRAIMDQLGYKYEELERSGTNTECCGFGGMTLPANPKVSKAVMAKRAGRSTTGHMVAYCAACRSAMETGGTDAVHLADLIFGSAYTSDKVEKRNAAPMQQWKTRYESKQNLIKSSK